MQEQAEEYREKLMEAAAEADEALMEKYFEEGELSNEEIQAGLKAGCLAMTIVPMTCGTAFKNKGVQTLLDAVVEYLPAPTEVADIRGETVDGEELVVKSTDDGKTALVVAGT